jgi:hypothetical protein
VFPVSNEQNSYILFRGNSVFKGLKCVGWSKIKEIINWMEAVVA